MTSQFISALDGGRFTEVSKPEGRVVLVWSLAACPDPLNNIPVVWQETACAPRVKAPRVWHSFGV